jgi:putative Mg2+ transporter-C (MgtC) family protein
VPDSVAISPLSLELISELGLAILLGGAIGVERELRDKPAGLRTHMLICMGAALFANLASRMTDLGGDPAHLAGPIVAGVGFIGAGPILHQGKSVTGLTTAANIWVVAAIGMMLGFGAYFDATAATVLVVVVLTLLGTAERAITRRFARHEVFVTVDPDVAPPLAAVTPILEALATGGLRTRLLGLRHEQGERTAHLEIAGGLDEETVLRRLLVLPGVRGARSA